MGRAVPVRAALAGLARRGGRHRARMVLPDRLSGLGPRWLVPTLEGALGAALLISSPKRISRESVRCARRRSR